MVGILRPRKLSHVTRNAGRGAQIVVIVDVAVGARYGRRGVPASQQETGRCVVELRVQPIVRRVAAFARRKECCAPSYVVRIRRFLEICLMARQAIRRHRLELAVARVLMASIAIYRGVRARQREAVIVILYLLYRNAPPAYRMALLAVRAQLAFVNVRVAVLALVAHVREHRLHVARSTSHSHVHAAQRILSLIMVEFRDRADRFPALRRMAVLAGNIEIAVGTLRRGDSGRLTARHRSGEHRQKQTQTGQSFQSHHSSSVWNRHSNVHIPNVGGSQYLCNSSSS